MENVTKLFADNFLGGKKQTNKQKKASVIINIFLVSIFFVEWKFYKSDRWGKMSVSGKVSSALFNKSSSVLR